MPVKSFLKFLFLNILYQSMICSEQITTTWFFLNLLETIEIECNLLKVNLFPMKNVRNSKFITSADSSVYLQACVLQFY